MRSIVVACCLGGCDFIFPLADPAPDPSMDGPGSSPDGLLTPPDTSAVCGPRPPIESWQFVSTTFPFDGPANLQQFTFYRAARDGELRAIATTGDQMFDVAADGTATPLPSLAPPPAASMSVPRVTYDGVALWFQQNGVAAGVYVAARATGWTKVRADLGFVNAERIEPGSVGYFADSARMVIAVAEVGSESTLHEISSLDGEKWTPLATIAFQTSGLGDHHPTLSPDGCYLIYTASNGTNELRISTREPDGTFATSTKLDNPSNASSAPSFPVLTPDQDALWFTAIVGATIERFRGQP